MSATFLIVDDDPVVQQILSMILSAAGHTPVSAGDDKRCYEELEERLAADSLPTAIFLDLMLGLVSGIDVLEKFRAMLGEKCPPVIMLSSNTQEEMIAGLNPSTFPDFYLQKPFNNADVTSLIDHIIADES